jgi:hypothetical protein
MANGKSMIQNVEGHGKSMANIMANNRMIIYCESIAD